jgi:hypothetical protein
MSERYFITGVQIGILKAINKHADPFDKIDEILKDVMDKQFIGNMPMPYEDYEITFVKKEKLKNVTINLVVDEVDNKDKMGRGFAEIMVGEAIKKSIEKNNMILKKLEIDWSRKKHEEIL